MTAHSNRLLRSRAGKARQAAQVRAVSASLVAAPAAKPASAAMQQRGATGHTCRPPDPPRSPRPDSLSDLQSSIEGRHHNRAKCGACWRQNTGRGAGTRAGQATSSTAPCSAHRRWNIRLVGQPGRPGCLQAAGSRRVERRGPRCLLCSPRSWRRSSRLAWSVIAAEQARKGGRGLQDDTSRE